MSGVWRIPGIARPFIGQVGAGEILINLIRSEYFDASDDGLQSWRPSHGARCLAEWLMRVPHRELTFDHDAISGPLLNRILIGDVDPTETVRQRIAAGTLGAILPEMFDQGLDLPLPKASAETMPFPRHATAPLGHLPDRGPLVQVGPIEGGYVLQMPGVSLTLDRATAAAVREALGRVIDAPPGRG